MSNPTLVKVIEESFVPILVHNNSGGTDRQILKKFNEPSWNYQVIRFIDSAEKDIIPRKDRVWTLQPLAQRMKLALEKAKQPVPEDLLSLL